MNDDNHVNRNDDNDGSRINATSTLISIQELRSPTERLKRRRILNVASDDIQYQLVRPKIVFNINLYLVDDVPFS
jgi:hypothetical protein